MSWKRYNLGELVDSVSIRAKNIVHENNLRFLGVSNEVGITDSKYAAEDKAEDYKIIEKGCFAYNPYRINVGSIGLMTNDVMGLISPAYVVFKPKPNSIIPELLLSFLKSKEGLRQIKLNARGTVRQALRFEDLCKIQLSLPRYDEQKELYLNLQKFEQQGNKQVIEHANQLDLLNKIRQQILQDALQGKLVKQDPNDEPVSKLLERIKVEKEKLILEKKIRKGKLQEAETQEEILFDIPKNWTWCYLDEICANITDGTHQTPTYTQTGRVFLSAQNVKPFRFMPDVHKYVSENSYQEYIKNKKPEKGDILVARVGAGIGEAAVIDQDLDFCFYVSLGLVQTFKEFTNSEFLTMVFNSPYGVKYSKGNVSSKGGSAGNFNLGRIRSFLIPFPPLLEQDRILKKVEQLMNLCDELEQSIQQNQKYTQELLQVALKEALEPE